MIRILVFGMTENPGGVESFLMNYYRHLDRNKVQFDFLYFNVSKFHYKTYQEEIESMGGKVFLIENFTKIREFNQKLNTLLKSNRYETVHIQRLILEQSRML